MCRICGRMVKCIFDSMPSRVTLTGTRSFSTALRSNQPQRIIRRSNLQECTGVSRLEGLVPCTASTFALPMRAKLHQATAVKQAPQTMSSGESSSPLPPSLLNTTQLPTATTPTNDITPSRPIHSKTLVISKSLQTLLPSLCAQQPHYITTHIHRFPYLIQAGDTLRLPFHMKGVSSGDVLRLNRASIIGSRDFTLKAGTSSTETYDTKRTGEPNYLDERLFEVRARVMGIESGPLFTKEKTKRRNRRVKTVKSKHRYTVLRIMEVKVKSLDELMKEEGTVLLES